MQDFHSKLNYNISRRDFLYLSTLSIAGFLTGCAANPVTGESQLMLLSERDETAIDRAQSPHQYSADYGLLQDQGLNEYLQQTGERLAANTHRPGMPYKFHGVNAVYMNAYAFPGGSIACTRGILRAIDNEAELAALLGHELGHVNARHTAEQISKGQMTSAVLGGIAAIIGTRNQDLGSLASGIGSIGAGALLAKYSRDNEREADRLGLDYMVKARYNPEGMIGLMDMLRSTSNSNHSMIELMFATHPMSQERYDNAARQIRERYADKANYSLYRERFMDRTAKLRSIRDAVEELQEGEKMMAMKDYPGAEKHFQKALKMAPHDYAGLIMMSKCKTVQGNHKEAKKYAELAKQSYPGEAQANYMLGYNHLKAKEYEKAYREFDDYEKELNGNPDIIFLKGLSLEGMGRKKPAAEEYYRYLRVVNQGEQAQYAYNRLVQWGYVK